MTKNLQLINREKLFNCQYTNERIHYIISVLNSHMNNNDQIYFSDKTLYIGKCPYTNQSAVAKCHYDGGYLNINIGDLRHKEIPKGLKSLRIKFQDDELYTLSFIRRITKILNILKDFRDNKNYAISKYIIDKTSNNQNPAPHINCVVEATPHNGFATMFETPATVQFYVDLRFYLFPQATNLYGAVITVNHHHSIRVLNINNAKLFPFMKGLYISYLLDYKNDKKDVRLLKNLLIIIKQYGDILPFPETAIEYIPEYTYNGG